MRFLYEYRTSDNARHSGEIKASTREAAFALLKSQGVKPSRLVEAPGFLNQLFGKGKRWLVIGVLALVSATAVCSAFRAKKTAQSALHEFDNRTRRQVIGDAAVVERGIRSGWADVFQLEGERFLASFAVPGVAAGLRNTSEAEIRKALEVSALRPDEHLSLEVRQIRAMVEGMKDELRQFLADGGTIVEYGQRLVQRQNEELGYYTRAKAELESAHKAGMDERELEALWEKRNASLRGMGIRLVSLPE